VKLSGVETLSIGTKDELVHVIAACDGLQNLKIRMDKKWKKTLDAVATIQHPVRVQLDRGQAWQVKHIDGLRQWEQIKRPDANS
jgi:hypothetical protein